MDDALRRAIARRLERAHASAPLCAAAVLWRAAADRVVARPLEIPSSARIVGIGGAVLGGAGKTPVAIAVVRDLARAGERVALVGHAYRAAPGFPREVTRDDPVVEVGDDALSSVRLLDGTAPVIVAPTRQAAVTFAASRGHRVLVVDGLLQAAPHRLACSVLVLDAASPWGAGRCPPAGDLRASMEALVSASDVIAAVGSDGRERSAALPAEAIIVDSRVRRAVSSNGVATELAHLRTRRVGLLLAIARPARILRALRANGIEPAVVVELADHAVPSRRALARAAGAGVDVWLTTARCATKLPPTLGESPVLALDHELDAADLVARITLQRGVHRAGE